MKILLTRFTKCSTITLWHNESYVQTYIHPRSYRPPNCDVRNDMHIHLEKRWSAFTGGRLWALNHLKVFETYPISFFVVLLLANYITSVFLCVRVNGEGCLVSQWQVEVVVVVEEAAAFTGRRAASGLAPWQSYLSRPLPCHTHIIVTV